MMYIQIHLTADGEIRVRLRAVSKTVEREIDDAVSRVFKGDDAKLCGAGLNSVKDVFDCDYRRVLIPFFGKGRFGGLFDGYTLAQDGQLIIFQPRTK